MQAQMFHDQFPGCKQYNLNNNTSHFTLACREKQSTYKYQNTQTKTQICPYRYAREEKEQFTYVLRCEELSQGSNMAICQVHHMDIVPDLILNNEKERRISIFEGVLCGYLLCPNDTFPPEGVYDVKKRKI